VAELETDDPIMTFQRTTRVQAWRVTETNGLEVAEWCRGGWYPAQKYVNVDNGETDDFYDEDSIVNVGDWVVRTELVDGAHFSPFTDEALRLTFGNPINEETK